MLYSAKDSSRINTMSTLAQLALARIPARQIDHMTAQEKTVVHYELFPICYRPRGYQQFNLYDVCDCVNYGRCLCYLRLIRNELQDQYWGTDQDFENLSGWIRVDRR